MVDAKLKMSASVIFSGVIIAIFLLFVDIRPQISPDFFFGSDDPEIAESKEIARLFPAEEFLVISVESQDIFSGRYSAQIKKLTGKLSSLSGFSRVISITNGPENAQKAAESPFWRPLLINQDESATLIIAFLARDSIAAQVPAAETIIAEFGGNTTISAIHISGMPYIVEQIRKSLIRDAKLFSTTVLVLFALLLWAIYRSLTIALGASLSGISAIFLTLTVLHFLKQPIGILTANLAIIIFVLVQSQAIYLTNNWLRDVNDDRSKQVTNAVKKTFPASFWCSVTTFLGFLSLLFVSAEPLRQLGAGGIIGVIAALLCCYIIFPSFLLYAKRHLKHKKSGVQFSDKSMRNIQVAGAILLIAGGVFAVPGLLKLETDPTLFSYFKEGGDIKSGLTSIDQNGGSSPLQLVVSLKDGSGLDREEAYEKLWKLHKDLAAIEQVGTVLSLPALMAEANDYPLAFLLPWSQIVSLLSLDINQRAVDNFLSSDRLQALFLLRMREGDRSSPRLSVVGEVERTANNHGFHLDHSGGVYVLQGRLATLVSSSLTTGILSLLALFLVIAFIITRRWRLSLVMFITASMIPLISLGGIGMLSVPLDIISAPAVSVSLGLAVDALIHLALAVTRKKDKGTDTDAWGKAIKEQGSGIIASSGVIFLGFLVFSLSDFPPTTRFGVTVIAGALLAGFAALTFFPFFSKMLSGQRQQ